MSEDKDTKQFPVLSLVQGGPTYAVFRRLGLCGADLEPMYKRAVIIAVVAWLPLLLLSLFERNAYGNNVALPFIRDLTAHIRFLVALPILLVAETAAHVLIGPLIAQFVERKIISGEEISKFRAVIESTHRIRDSIVIEVVLIIVVYTVGIWIWNSQVDMHGPTWFASPDGVHTNLTLTGYWLVFVSVPLFQFFLLRWYARTINWFVFLFRVSRLKLKLIATHSDVAGGIGFIGQCAYGFSFVLFAEGSLVSAFIANGVINGGHNVMEYKFEAIVSVIVFLVMILGPLTVFTPSLIRAKWEALAEFGSFASRYVEGFDTKWMRGVNPKGEELIGTGDIQSLADLSNSYSVIQDMQALPFGTYDIVWLAVITLVPLFPLVFFEFSIEEIFDKVVRVLF